MMDWKRAALTAVLAYALVLQALAFSFAGALHAAAAGLPETVLCTPGTASVPDEPGPDKPHDLLCCTLACHGSAAPLGPAPAAATPGLPSLVRSADLFPYAPPFLRLSSDILPLGSRAPPRVG